MDYSDQIRLPRPLSTPDARNRPAKSDAAFQIKYRSDIDGLRALAVSLVVLFHAFPGLVPGGFIGVDIFFVISGYLISFIIFAERGVGRLGSGRFSLKAFYIRRACRILPALLIVMLAVLAAAWLILLPDEFSRLGGHIRGGGFFVSNLQLKKEIGYFEPAADTKPLLHLWSLAIEEQFYFAWPLIAVGISLFRRYAAFLIVALFLASFADNLVHLGLDPVGTFYLPLTRVWELLAGAALAGFQYQSKAAAPTIAGTAASYVAALSMLLILACVFLFAKTDPFPGWRALVPVVCATALIAVEPNNWTSRAILSHPAMVFVGRISYPLYLWHWPLLSFARIVRGEELSGAVTCGLIGVAVGLSWFTYRFVETPVRRSRHRGWLALALVGFCLALGGLGDLMTHLKNASYAARFGLEKINAAIAEKEYPFQAQVFAFPSWPGTLLKREGVGGSVLYVGDSNMEQYELALTSLQERNPASYKTAYFMITRDCLPLPDITNHGTCDDLIPQARKLVEARNIDTVVLAAQWWGYFVDQRYPMQYQVAGLSLDTAEGRVRALRSLEAGVRYFVERGRKVYLVLNIPVGPHMDPKSRIVRSFLNFTVRDQGVARSELLARYGETHRQIAEAARKGGAIVIDPLETLCGPGDWCPAQEADGSPMYRDRTHLRAGYVRDHLRYLDETLKNGQ